MRKKQTVSAEIVRKTSPDDMKAMLDRVVTEKVQEALAERDLEQLAPVYRSRRIRPVHPGFEREKYALYFEKHGCRDCGRKNVTHMCNALCDRCNNRYVQRMMSLEREWVRNHPESQILEDIDHLTRRLRSAREL
jgi:hypothetical protein